MPDKRFINVCVKTMPSGSQDFKVFITGTVKTIADLKCLLQSNGMFNEDQTFLMICGQQCRYLLTNECLVDWIRCDDVVEVQPKHYRETTGAHNTNNDPQIDKYIKIHNIIVVLVILIIAIDSIVWSKSSIKSTPKTSL